MAGRVGVKIYFARHGESEANLLNIFANRTGFDGHPLTKRGRGQVEALAENLKAQQIDQIYASPVFRARESAELIAAKLGVRFDTSEALREYDVGSLEGTCDEAGWKQHDDVLSAWLLEHRWGERTGGGESFDEMAARFVPFSNDLRINHRGQTVLVIGHSGLFRCMLPHVLANVSYRYAHAHPLGHTSWVLAVDEGELLCRQWAGRSLTAQTARAGVQP